MSPDLRTVTIARDIAEEEAADAYDALFSEILDLREEVEALRRELGTLRRTMLVELNRLRDALG